MSDLETRLRWKFETLVSLLREAEHENICTAVNFLVPCLEKAALILTRVQSEKGTED